MIALSSTEITKAYLGSTEIDKMYLGENLVFGGDSPTPVLPYDAQVEYLQSDGNQYINLLTNGSEATDAFEITFQQTTAQNQCRFVAPSSENICQMYVNGSNSFGYRYNGGWRAAVTNNTLKVGTTKYTWKVDYKNKKNTINGTDYTISITTSSQATTENLYLIGKFGTNPQFKGKVFSFTMWRNNAIVLDMIPVRKNGVGYMYDKESGELFGNSGSGSFTYGNDVTT